jgi:hypothetical protein
MAGRFDADSGKHLMIELGKLRSLNYVLLKRIAILAEAKRVKPFAYIDHGRGRYRNAYRDASFKRFPFIRSAAIEN